MDEKLIDIIMKHSADKKSAKIIIKSVIKEFRKSRKNWGYLRTED